MTEFLGSIGWFIVTLGLLITFHEFGHFWVARRLGVRVLRFSVGFGRPLWRRTGRDGTEYVLAAIPLGGYVKMLDEREADVPPAQAHQSFNRQPVWGRIAIVAAGPLANILFAIGAFWLMFVVGKPDFRPVIDDTTGIAAAAGLRAGDELARIDQQAVSTWTEATIALVTVALARNDVDLEVREPDGDLRSVRLEVSQVPRHLDEREALGAIGIRARAPIAPAAVGQVVSGRPAAAAGMRPGDLIESVNGQPVADFQALIGIVQSEANRDPRLAFTVNRNGASVELAIIAEATTAPDGSTRWMIGIAPPDLRDTVRRHGPLAALPAAIGETWRMTATTFEFLGRMLVGHASLDNVAGPVGIAQTANSSASMGLAWFLSFLALMSLSIGILNLLPIPILDGGHLLYYLIEIVKGSPVSDRVMATGHYLGILMLTGLMGLAFYNDIARLLP
jgi:regulator of sigma E protease